MIAFDLVCRAGAHRFEGWFGSSDDFEQQKLGGLLSCPVCGDVAVDKAVMAPNVGRKGNQLPATRAAERGIEPAQQHAAGKLPPEAVQMMQALAAMQAEALKQSRWVGGNFAEQSRKMHYGEADAETIHGQATLGEARELLEEGIPVMPLPFPVAPPDKLN